MINIQWMKMTVIIPTDVEFIKKHVIQRGYQYGVILQMQMKQGNVLNYNWTHKKLLLGVQVVI